MQKARHHPLHYREGSDCLRAVWFQVLFHSPPGVLFTFPSRYWFAIGGSVYLALEGGPPRFPQGSSCPVVLGYQHRSEWLEVRDSHPLRCAVPGSFPKPIPNPARRLLKISANTSIGRDQLTPQPRRAGPFGLGSSPFARRYLGYHVCFLFLRVLRCFSSPRALSPIKEE
jgi:hypothetical protein